MRGPVSLVAVLAVIAAAIGFSLQDKRSQPAEVGSPRVKLTVLVVFDQMRGDYPERWKTLFVTDGFARLQTEGATFVNCHYPYAITTTGPGHASMLSGTCPDRHGIVNNNWYDGGASCTVPARCATSSSPPAPTPKGEGSRQPGSDARGDRRGCAAPNSPQGEDLRPVAQGPLRDSPDRQAARRRVLVQRQVRHFDATTPSAYHPWVEEFNDSKAADQWFGKDWTRFRTDIDYEKWSRAGHRRGRGQRHCGDGEGRPGKGLESGRSTFPHPNTGGRAKPGKEYYEALANSPFGNELLLEFAKRCVTAERLGADDVPDLLVVSFSSNDLIGHTWGPDSQEVLDVTLRSDALVADLLGFLDAKVGKDQYLLAVTADHGICPLPEVSR